MAVMIPEKPIGKASPEIIKVFHALKRIPGDQIECRYDMSLGDRTQPEFLILVERRAVFLLAVSSISQQNAERVIQISLFAGEEKPLSPEEFGMEATSTIRSFWNLLLEVEGINTDSLSKVQKIVLLPNVPQSVLDRIQQLREFPDYQLWGSEYLSHLRLYEAFTQTDDFVVETTTINALRRSFEPEIIIPNSFQPRGKTQATINAKLTGSLLDIDQERVAKMDLMLSDEGTQAVEQATCRLVTGVAGSGKTLVLIYRALMCKRIKNDARILSITHNKALIHYMEDRFKRLYPKGRIEWVHFLKWCHQLLGGFTIASDELRLKIIGNHSKKFAHLEGLSVNFLKEELDWIMDNGLTRKSDYLKADRVGRGRPLNEKQRSSIFDLFRAYRMEISEKKLDDWSGVPLSLLTRIRGGTIQLPRYDFIFIDEAQFFAPVWFEIIKYAIEPNGQLFLAADPTQGFLKRRQSWKACGLDVVGRSVKLRRSYRCTKRIYKFAAEYYKKRLPIDEEDGTSLPDDYALALAPEGSEPEQICLSGQDEVTRLERECLEFAKQGGDLKQILVIHCDGKRVKDIENRLSSKLSQFRPSLPKVLSINAVTGLEAPVVFLVGVNSLLENEGNPLLTIEEQKELIRDNTRRLYVAMTRATQRLIIISKTSLVDRQ